MADQQERLVSKEFIAGLLVGEGHFGLGLRQRRGHRFQVTPIMHLAMTDLESQRIISASLTDLGLAHYVLDMPARGRYLPQTDIRVLGAKRMNAFLDVFLPLLTGRKLEAAEAVRDFIAVRFEKPHITSPYDDRELECIIRVRAANGRQKGTAIPIEQLRKMLAMSNRIH